MNSFATINLYVARVFTVVTDKITIGREFVVIFLDLSILIVQSGVVVVSLTIGIVWPVLVAIVAIAVVEISGSQVVSRCGVVEQPRVVSRFDAEA